MTEKGWYLELLAAARAEYEMGYCTRGEYERGTLALVAEWERRQTTRRELARKLRTERLMARRDARELAS